MIYSFKSLEFDKIIDIFQSKIITHSGKIELKNVQPMVDAQKIKTELIIVKDAYEFIKFDGNFSFEEIGDIKDSLSNIKIEGFVLTTVDICNIKKTLEIFSINYRSISPYSSKYTHLFNIMSDVNILEDLISKLNKIIDNEGNILDTASENLKRIRKRKVSLRGEIHSSLLKIMDREDYKEGLRERIITIRDGRYVVPIKSAYKNRIKSIVHSFSKSGETAFIEPNQVVALNNEMIGIDEEELAEIRMILRFLTDEIKEVSEDISLINYTLGRLEVITVKARFAIDQNKQNSQNFGFPEIVDDKVYFQLYNAYHPLLKVENTEFKKIIPINIEAGLDFNGLIISGPNAGGKTVALKLAGLLTLMAMSGIPIPADNKSKIGIFHKVIAEIGDEQSISENLSTFSGHILNISKILKESDQKTLVLIDEIASSTEPKEGEALGIEIIKELISKNARFIITTHFHGIKEIAYTDERVRNAYVEFDEENLAPLYKLHIGAAGSSYALNIAKRYGLDDSILDRAKIYIEKHFTRNEKLIRSIETERNKLYRQKEITSGRLSELKLLKEKLLKKTIELDNEKQMIEKKGVGILKNELDRALKQISELRNELKKKKIHDLKKADEVTNEAKKVLIKMESKILERVYKKAEIDQLEPGDKIYVNTLGKEGVVEDILGDKVKARFGIFSSIIDIKDIFIHPINGDEKRISYTYSAITEASNYIIDLRGFRADEAIKTLEKELDHALINGSNELMIIHGKGEGILRKAVWDILKKQDHIASFHYAKPDEGGQGKTIVLLK